MELEIIVKEPVSDKCSTPILFIHGMWHSAWSWSENFLPYFAKCGYLSSTLSLRGHGNSKSNKELRWISLADYVADVRKAVAQMEKPPILIGHSMGGMIIQKYLESHQAPAAILLAPIPYKGLFSTTLRILRRYPLSFLKSNLKLSLQPVIATSAQYSELLFSENTPQEKINEYFSRTQDDSYRAFIDMLFLNLPRPQRIKTPMLVLGAGKDRVISAREIETTARAYNAQAEFFPDVAHSMILEPGWQPVAERIISWLKGRDL